MLFRILLNYFCLQVAVYAKQDLKMTEMCIFLLAFCATKVESEIFLKKYFPACIKHPDDLVQVVQFLSVSLFVCFLN